MFRFTFGFRRYERECGGSVVEEGGQLNADFEAVVGAGSGLPVDKFLT